MRFQSRCHVPSRKLCCCLSRFRSFLSNLSSTTALSLHSLDGPGLPSPADSAGRHALSAGGFNRVRLVNSGAENRAASMIPGRAQVSRVRPRKRFRQSSRQSEHMVLTVWSSPVSAFTGTELAGIDCACCKLPYVQPLRNVVPLGTEPIFFLCMAQHKT